MGIFFAFVAVFAWAFDDFLIQKSTRKFGNIFSLFFIEVLATVALFPFVFDELPQLANQNGLFYLLLIISVITLFAALLEFEALRRGKLSVIEPIFAFEVPVVVLLGATLLGEVPTVTQGVFLVGVLIGTIMVSSRSSHNVAHLKWERGVWLAIMATTTMGIVSLLFGVMGRFTSPLMINWFSSTVIAITLFMYLLVKGQLHTSILTAEKYKQLIFSVGFLDNLAWVAFVYSMTYIPLGIASGITESYVAISALLGLFINREFLRNHQKIGLGLTVTSAVLLAVVAR